MTDTIAITVDCSADDFEKVAAFWSAALGYERLFPGYLVDPAGVRHHIDEVVQGFSNVFTTLIDPGGNEFCACAPHVRVADASG